MQTQVYSKFQHEHNLPLKTQASFAELSIHDVLRATLFIRCGAVHVHVIIPRVYIYVEIISTWDQVGRVL